MSILNIIIPVYNGEKYISDTLNSLFKQSFQDFTLIIVNDGSIDNTLKILEKYKTNHKNMIVLSKENKGPGSARNVGLTYSKKIISKYTLFLDSDDLYDSKFLEKMVNNSERYNADITICKSSELNSINNKICEITNATKEKLLPKNYHSFKPVDIKDYLFKFCIGWTWDKLYKTSFIISNNLIFQELENTDDVYFVFSSLYKANSISFLKDNLIFHKTNINTSVSSKKNKNENCCWEAIKGIKESLIKDNKYNCYEKTFINWAIKFSIWFLRTNKNLDENSNQFNNYLKNEKEILVLDNYPQSYFYNKFEYKMYLLIKKNRFKKFILKSKKRDKLKKIITKLSENSKFFNKLTNNAN